jgi:hypothetical protein
LTSRNGNRRIAPISLKITSIVNPTILKGRRINQTIGRRKIKTSANGQQSTNKMHQRIIAISVLISINTCIPQQNPYQMAMI